MKNLMIYLNPLKIFTEDYLNVVEIQIENSLIYWEKEDILLVTNFPYNHGGINSFVVPDDLFCEHRKRASKINVICYLLENNLVDDSCWFHDFDAFQVSEFPGNILEDKDVAFTDYAHSEIWNTGSFFFNLNSLYIFQMIKEVMYRDRINEEHALCILTNSNAFGNNYLYLDSSYNMTRRHNTKYAESKAIFPIKVLHFHPKNKNEYKLAIPFMPSSLISLFTKYGYSSDNE